MYLPLYNAVRFFLYSMSAAPPPPPVPGSVSPYLPRQNCMEPNRNDPRATFGTFKRSVTVFYIIITNHIALTIYLTQFTSLFYIFQPFSLLNFYKIFHNLIYFFLFCIFLLIYLFFVIFSVFVNSTQTGVTD